MDNISSRRHYLFGLHDSGSFSVIKTPDNSQDFELLAMGNSFSYHRVYTHDNLVDDAQFDTLLWAIVVAVSATQAQGIISRSHGWGSHRIDVYVDTPTAQFDVIVRQTLYDAGLL